MIELKLIYDFVHRKEYIPHWIENTGDLGDAKLSIISIEVGIMVEHSGHTRLRLSR